MTRFDQLCDRAKLLGLAVRGGFHPHPGEFQESFPSLSIATVVLLGFTGSAQWACFEGSPEARDGRADPLDRWSRRQVGTLAREFAATDVYPSGPSPAPLPFQRLALRSEPVHQSPIGLLIHPTWGLWHAYRGALLWGERIELPDIVHSPHPCTSCAGRPCLSACPVDAFTAGGFSLQRCLGHVRSPGGAPCREEGCLARRACPVGAGHRYREEQDRFHMRAFLRSMRA